MPRNLGLAANQVELLQHSSGWAAAYEAEHGRLRELLDQTQAEIEHVGSTAVPDLPAKPIIDIAVSIDMETGYAEIRQILLRNGYEYLVDAGSEGGHIFYRESAPGIRAWHLHLIDKTDIQWRNYLVFRNLLRNDPVKRSEYAALKAKLAAAFPNDRESYTAGKNDFISRTLSGSES